MDIFVRGLDVYAYHGCADAEREIGHRFCVDIIVTVPDTSGADDDLTSTVDYAALGMIATDVLVRQKRKLVEVLVAQIADEILERFPSVSRVQVTVEKPAPPAPMIAEAVGVTLVRFRD